MKLIFDAVGIRGGGAHSILDDLLITFPLVDKNIQIQLYVIPAQFRDFEVKDITLRILNSKKLKYPDIISAGLSGKILYSPSSSTKTTSTTSSASIITVPILSPAKPFISTNS